MVRFKKRKSTSVSPPINWAEIPQELISSILLRLPVDWILLSPRVCKSWRRVSRDPLMWRKIDMNGVWSVYYQNLCREVVDLSQGDLMEINIRNYSSDKLLDYIADRSSHLRSLKFEIDYGVTNKGLVNAIAKLPLLETLEISHSRLKLNLKAIGQACPQLQALKLNCSYYILLRIIYDDDDYALAIAKSMPQLRHLQLLGSRLTNTGLNAILDNLHHLEHLDLRKCFNVNLVGNLEKRCLERVKKLRRPWVNSFGFKIFIC